MRLALAIVAAMLAAAAPASAHRLDLDFRGEAIVPSGTMFQGTTVGGLSSITYDSRRGVYYAMVLRQMESHGETVDEAWSSR